jgi:pimeloyl-ACP methyl ester carboxylesterase
MLSTRMISGTNELSGQMKMLTPLANAGYRAIAPELRGYGRTTGWDADYDGGLRQFRILNVTRDVVRRLRCHLPKRSLHASG